MAALTEFRAKNTSSGTSDNWTLSRKLQKTIHAAEHEVTQRHYQARLFSLHLFLANYSDYSSLV
jgi:hypothetical protein